MARTYKNRKRKAFMSKPVNNMRGLIPRPIITGRRIRTELVPRVANLIAGGVMAKPLWFDAVLAHPPPLDQRVSGPRPQRFEWRDEDRLRRTWQNRHPEASMHPKVLFLDESQLPAGTPVDHPADNFVRQQMKLMRKGLSEEEAYRRVQQQQQQDGRGDADEVAAARDAARALGATPAEGAAGGGGRASRPEGFAARLLRRFAEEAREGGQPYPKHWFLEQDGAAGKGPWRGTGAPEEIDKRTAKALENTARAQSPGAVDRMMAGMQIRDARDAQAAAAEAEAEAAEAEAADTEAEPEAGKGLGKDNGA